MRESEEWVRSHEKLLPLEPFRRPTPRRFSEARFSDTHQVTHA